MRKRSSIPPTDENSFARFIVDTVTSEPGATPPTPEPQKNPAAVSLGRLGGLKGGKARAASLSKRRKSQIAREAARARWGKK